MEATPLTPEARLAAAAQILDTLDFKLLVDPQLKAWARKNRYAGSGDRRAIADRVYTILRRKRSSEAIARGQSGRSFVLGSLVSDDGLDVDGIADLCKGSYGLEPLSDQERADLSTEPTYNSDAERLDWPEWLFPQAIAAFGETITTELDAMRKRAPLDLRVNSLRAIREEAIALLDAEGITAKPVEIATSALRVVAATRILTTEAYCAGVVELQDAASQAVAAFAKPEPGESVLDFCAGAGGKTLALAALMENRGVLVAHDIDARRMEDIPLRAERAGVTIISRAKQSEVARESFDTVLVDAPCSGSGSWRRDPLGKWRLTPEMLKELGAVQRDALSSAAGYVRPGGTLTYATCSVLPVENHDQRDWFSSQHNEFALEDSLTLWPARDDCDGFFAARFRRRN